MHDAEQAILAHRKQSEPTLLQETSTSKACKVLLNFAKVFQGESRTTDFDTVIDTMMLFCRTCRFPSGPTDVAIEASLRDLFHFAQQVFGRPADVVVVNAGVTEVGRLAQDVVESKPS